MNDTVMANGTAQISASSLPPSSDGRLIQVSIESEMRNAYLDYAMSVIIGRAIPDVRDGLKPVHRRTLYAMYEAKNFYNQPYKKSARIVGEVIGKYHPHGDAAVYDSLVRMAQDFAMREVLVDGQGNFGSLDGDPPAAMRYTEVRLTHLAQMLLDEIEQETVDWSPNYDESLVEPKVLPARFPNLMVNGANGIAVGMATNIPPHNLGEVIEATVALIRNPEMTLEEIMEILPGPDFPTGGVIVGTEGIRSAYLTGQGSITIRAKAEIEEDKKGKERIVITEVPYQSNKAKILERIAELVRDKKLPGISDVRDESNREGVRVVIELRKDASSRVVLNQLFKMTPLQDTFGVKNLSIVRGQPRVLTLKETLQEFIDFRVEVVTRRSKFELKKAEERLHILEGLRIAVDNIDETISIIRGSHSTQEAETKLIERFSLSERQVKAILDMRLARLTGLERDKIEDEIKSLGVRIAELMMILSQKARLMEVIVKELEEIKEKFGGPRKSRIETEAEMIRDEDLIPEEEMVVAVSHLGYIKRTPVTAFRSQGRGGKGVTGMETREEDFIRDIYICSSHATMLFFSDNGKVYSKKVYEIPLAPRAAKGKAIINFVGMDEGEKVAAVVPVAKMSEGNYVVTVTKKGLLKKSDIMLYSNIRSSGIIGVIIEEGDRLVGAAVTDGKADLLLCTRKGMSIRFCEDEIRPTGRASRGVVGIRLKSEDDEVVGMSVLPSVLRGDMYQPSLEEEREEGEEAEEEEEEGVASEEGKEGMEEEETYEVEGREEYTVLTVCEKGYGKRTNLSEHRCQGRGGKGIIAIKTTPRNGKVVGMTVVRENDDLMIVTTKGTFIRIPVTSIPVMGRSTQGVRLIKLEEDEFVASVDKVREGEVLERREGEAVPPLQEAEPPVATVKENVVAEEGNIAKGVVAIHSPAPSDSEENGSDLTSDWESAIVEDSTPQ